MPPRGLDTLPVEIQTMILTEVVSNPCPNDQVSGWKELRFGLRCMRVCKLWNEIVRRPLPKLLPARPFLLMGLETSSFEAVGHEILKREEMIAKASSRGNMSDDAAASEFDKLIHDLWACFRLAIFRGFIPSMKLRLENVPEFSEINESAYMLHPMAGVKQPEVLKTLLDQDWILKNIEQRNASGDTPLGNAAHRRNYRNMEILMDYGASTDISPSKDRVMMKYAYSANTLGGSGRLLTFATIKGDAKMLDLLLRRGLKPEWEENTSEDTHLSIALKKNNLEMAQKLLDHGASVRFERRQTIFPLNSAIESCSLDMVKKLVDLGADYTGRIASDALSTAATHDRQDVFTFLLGRGAILKPYHLIDAVGHSLSITAQILDIDGVEYAGPAFTWACSAGYKDFVRVFLDHGVDPNSRDICGILSALEIAIDASETEIVRILLDAGADATGISKGSLLSSVVLDEKYGNSQSLT